jgi:hypothetical protein
MKLFIRILIIEIVKAGVIKIARKLLIEIK